MRHNLVVICLLASQGIVALSCSPSQTREEQDRAKMLEAAKAAEGKAQEEALLAWYKGEQKKLSDASSRQVVEDAVSAAQESIKKLQWDEGISHLDIALGADPDNVEVKILRKKLEENRAGKQALEQAKSLSNAGRDLEAISVLDSVPLHSVYAHDLLDLKNIIMQKSAKSGPTRK